MPTSPEKVAEGFQTYGIYYVVGALVVVLAAIFALILTGKLVFSREMDRAFKQLDANTAIMANMENNTDAEIRKELYNTTEQLKETKALVSSLAAQNASLASQNEKLLNTLEVVRDDLRDIKSRGGGRSA